MGTGAAQQQQMDQMGGSSAAAAGATMDKRFVTKAMGGNLAEVQMGQLALEKSSDPQVKEFAQRMVDDHTKMQEQLKPIAQQMGVKVPDNPPKAAMKKMDKMKALSGDAFDQAYLKDMVKDHKADLSEFQQEASTTQNADLKQLATQGGQTIQSHLDAVEQLAKTKGISEK
jgi:putative membrane protein